MEYYWGYAAATHRPLSSNFFERRPRSNTTRSNSSSSPLSSSTPVVEDASTTPEAAATSTANSANTRSLPPPRLSGRHTRAKSTDSSTSSSHHSSTTVIGSASLLSHEHEHEPLLHPHWHHNHNHHLQIPPHRGSRAVVADSSQRQQPSLPNTTLPAASTKDFAVGATTSHDENHSAAWWETGRLAATAAELARPASAAAAERTTSVLRKPAPGSPAAGGGKHHHHLLHLHHRQQQKKHKQLPPVPRINAAPVDTASPVATVAASSHGDSGSHPLNTTASYISTSVAALAVGSGAALPLTPTSPTKTSIGAWFPHPSSSSYSSTIPSDGKRTHPPTQSSPKKHPKRNHHHHHSATEHHNAAMSHDAVALHKSATAGVPISRAESTSSTSGATPSLSVRTAMSTDAGSSNTDASNRPRGGGAPGGRTTRPFIVRNGRTYIADPTVSYPLPVDLAELHRQAMRTLMLLQLFNGPVCSPQLAKKPPTRVLDVGCGSGFWSMMCHRWYAQRGHPNISFTGLDVAPISGASAWGGGGASARSSSSSSGADQPPRPDSDMKWRFVQHNISHTPWPFQDGEFDLVMMQGTSLANPVSHGSIMMDEIVRILQPGGTVEIWESDHTIRMLRPHVPETPASEAATNAGGSAPSDDGTGGGGDDASEEAAKWGAYVMTGNTPMSSPLNNFLVEYNSWLIKALDARSLTPVPCTTIGPMLVMEGELTGLGSRRLAVPFSEVKWEREGVGGVVTKDGKSYITKGMMGGASAREQEAASSAKSGLTPAQTAIRRTALMTVVQMIQSLEPVLREVSGKSQDEWDGWQGKMMNDLLKENGTSWGECLEVGAWWARKRGPGKK